MTYFDINLSAMRERNPAYADMIASSEILWGPSRRDRVVTDEMKANIRKHGTVAIVNFGTGEIIRELERIDVGMQLGQQPCLWVIEPIPPPPPGAAGPPQRQPPRPPPGTPPGGRRSFESAAC